MSQPSQVFGLLYIYLKTKLMPTQITINTLTGSQPFDVYLCDDPVTFCVYIDTITSSPYAFNVPSLLDGMSSYNLKIVDNNGCSVFENLIP